MTPEDAAALIGGARVGGTRSTWADLGCGDGTFTLALTTLLRPGSTIHAMDRDANALRRIPRSHAGVSIVTYEGDFTMLPWPFGAVNGVLLANSLHYVQDQRGFIRACQKAMTSPCRFLIVEYDTDKPNRWVPNPISRRALEKLFANAGYGVIHWLGSRPSLYRRTSIYGALIEGARPD